METAFSASRPTSSSEPLAAPAQEFIGSLKPDNWLLAALEEYKSLRMESLGFDKVQNSILGYESRALVHYLRRESASSIIMTIPCWRKRYSVFSYP